MLKSLLLIAKIPWKSLLLIAKIPWKSLFFWLLQNSKPPSTGPCQRCQPCLLCLRLLLQLCQFPAFLAGRGWTKNLGSSGNLWEMGITTKIWDFKGDSMISWWFNGDFMVIWWWFHGMLLWFHGIEWDRSIVGIESIKRGVSPFHQRTWWYKSS